MALEPFLEKMAVRFETLLRNLATLPHDQRGLIEQLVESLASKLPRVGDTIVVRRHDTDPWVPAQFYGPALGDGAFARILEGPHAGAELVFSPENWRKR